MKLFENATDGVNSSFVSLDSSEPQALNAGDKGEVKQFRLQSPKEQETQALEKHSDIFSVQASNSQDIDESLDQNIEGSSEAMEEDSIEEKTEAKAKDNAEATVKEKTFFFKNTESANSKEINKEKDLSFEEVMMGFSGRREFATQLTILPEIKVVADDVSIKDDVVESTEKVEHIEEEVDLQEQQEAKPVEIEQADVVTLSDINFGEHKEIYDSKMTRESKDENQSMVQETTEKIEAKNLSFVDKEFSKNEQRSTDSQQLQDLSLEEKEQKIVSDNLVEESTSGVDIFDRVEQKYESKNEKDLKIGHNEKMVDGLIRQSNEDASKKDLLTSSFGKMEVKDLHLLRDDNIFEKEEVVNTREDSLAMFSKILPGDFAESIVIDSKPSIEERQVFSVMENFGFLDLEESASILAALQNLITKQAAKLVDAPEGTVIVEEDLPHPFLNNQLLLTKEQDGVVVNIESKIAQFSNEVKVNENVKELPGGSEKNPKTLLDSRDSTTLQTPKNSENFSKPVPTPSIDKKKISVLRNVVDQLKHNGIDIKSLQVGNTLARFAKKSSHDSVKVFLKDEKEVPVQIDNKNPVVQEASLANQAVVEGASLAPTQAVPTTDLSWVSDLIVDRLDSMAFAVDMATGVQTVEMVMAESKDVPSVFLGAGLALEKEGNDINVSFHSFTDQAQEISAVQLVENGQAQLVELMKALGKRNLSLQGLRVGEHSVSLPQGTEDVITPFQFMEAALQHDLGEDRRQDSGKQDQEEEEPTLLEKEMI
ncbi:hypothetical protein CLAVI_000288 [Candidatus Clavichlamydia salmonicola]|uniref:DUF5421 family protein n=1 Tax=Candidatus Clavichlamydia salmonicola TaxID=469812 RepID=UPI001891B05A|nr:DUF5421 family protein [Candidatus Clavichlamydia salmonicola]MBF5050673.1 hypothetical protein [Candidatus Clavichlamydia salmonicola]